MPGVPQALDAEQPIASFLKQMLIGGGQVNAGDHRAGLLTRCVDGIDERVYDKRWEISMKIETFIDTLPPEQQQAVFDLFSQRLAADS